MGPDRPALGNRVTGEIIGAALEVHRALGPGLLESTYAACLAEELRQRRIAFLRQVELPLFYKGVRVDCAYRLDFLVEDEVVVELKAVAAFEPVFSAQLLTYLRLTRKRIGLLINFNVPILRDGIRRFVL